MGKNLTRVTLTANGSWVCPGGVTKVRVSAYAALRNQIALGSGFSSVTTMDGNVYGWGANNIGQNGTGTGVGPISSPVAVLGGFQARTIASGSTSTSLISTNGALYSWGGNSFGELGIGNVNSQSSPVAVLGGLTWREIARGSGSSAGYAIGVNVAGSAYAFGENITGQLGVGDVLPRSSPVAVLGGFTWDRVTCATRNAAGIRSDTKTAYCWGANANGECGLGDLVSRSSPVAVLGGLTWKTIAGGGLFFLGITTAGDMYAWGTGGSGQLGTGNTASVSSPVAVLGGLKWRFVACRGASAMGITVDGKAYAWGKNASGQLGLGDIVFRSSPVAVLGGLTWRSVGLSDSDPTSAFGITTGGVGYAWGLNTNGQLGLGDTVNRSSPVAVLGGLTWRSVDVAKVAEQLVSVIPGNTYTATIFAAVTQFGPTALYTDAAISGSIPIDIVLEYFA